MGANERVEAVLSPGACIVAHAATPNLLLLCVSRDDLKEKCHLALGRQPFAPPPLSICGVDPGDGRRLRMSSLGPGGKARTSY